MVLTRSQLEQLPVEELIDYAVKMGELALKYEILDKRNTEFETRISTLEASRETDTSTINVLSNCNTLLLKRVKHIERDLLNASQYLRNRQIEVHNVPEDVDNTALPEKVCEAISLTGSVVTPNHLDKCHRLSNNSSVILEFNTRKDRDNILFNRKSLKNKQEELAAINMKKIFITDSLCFEYKKLDYVCRCLKDRGEIKDCWFFNGKLFIILLSEEKLTVRSIDDLYNRFTVPLINSFLKKRKR